MFDKSDIAPQSEVSLRPDGNPLLSGVVSNHLDGTVTGINDYRRYAGIVDMSTTIRSLPETSSKSVIYEIGAASLEYAAVLAPVRGGVCVGQTVQTSELVSHQLTTLHRKYSNFTGVYELMDLSAVGFHLAKCVVKYSMTGTLTCQEMRCGMPFLARVVGISSDPITANDSSVFIPRTTATRSAPAAFTALTCAVNAYGGTVYTDVLEMDGNNAPIMVEHADGDLAAGCYAGLRILLAMYNQCNQGTTMAYAILKGFHTMATVVGHTDEGGYIRSVLRTIDFRVPYGGIHMDEVTEYCALPMPNAESRQQLCACIDSILLATAAAVAVADPCVSIDGRIYPSTYTTPHYVIDTDKKERDRTGKIAANDIAKKIAMDCGKFIDNYLGVVSKIFGVMHNGDVAHKHMFTSFANNVSTGDRHLRMSAVAPYYWIEPTGILPRGFGTVAEDGGFASLCSVGVERVVEALPKAKIAVQMGSSSLVGYEHRTARTVPLLTYLQGHALDGLASIVPMNFTAESFGFVGGETPANINRDHGFDMGRYLWGRGQSAVIAPAEALYTGKTMGVGIHHCTLTNDFSINEMHMYTSAEIVGATISMIANRPYRIPNGGLSKFPRTVTRVRTSALRALEAARQYMYSRGVTGGEKFIASNTELVFVEVDDSTAGEVTLGDVNISLSRTAVPHRGPTAARIFQDVSLKVPHIKPASAPIVADARTSGAYVPGGNAAMHDTDAQPDVGQPDIVVGMPGVPDQ